MKHCNNTKSDSSTQLAVVGPGQMLRNLRLAANIPAADIQRELGITGSLFNALEEDDFQRLPGPVFVKGYLRRYAQLVGARPAALLANYQQFLEDHHLVEKPVVEMPPLHPKKTLIGSAVALLLATSLVFGAMLSDGGGEGGTLGAPAIADQDMLPDQGSVLPAEQRLEVEFIADSWVEIVDAREHILAVSLQRAGDRLYIEGIPPFRVHLGNGRGVVVRYLGESVALPLASDNHSVALTLGVTSTE